MRSTLRAAAQQTEPVPFAEENLPHPRRTDGVKVNRFKSATSVSRLLPAERQPRVGWVVARELEIELIGVGQRDLADHRRIAVLLQDEQTSATV